MAETYCGKSCGECGVREELNCPGCGVGPGRPISGECELAQCCRTKGHESCGTCCFQSTCGNYRSRADMADRRRRKALIEADVLAGRKKRGAFLGQWMNVLFWLHIVNLVKGIVFNDFVTEQITGLWLPGLILSSLCSIACGAVLIRMASEGDGYRTAGICLIIVTLVDLAINCAFGGETPGWTLVITIPTLIVSLYGEYKEYFSHGDMMQPFDRGLSDKWYLLFKWCAASCGALFGGTLLIVILPVLGLLVVLAATIAMTVVSVLYLVYLRRSVRILRDYQNKEEGV